METIGSYIQSQAIINAIVNMIVNPAINPGLTWLVSGDMQAIPLTEILIDMTITCLVMSTVIALFVTSGVKRGLGTGNIRADDDAPSPRWLSRFPRASLTLGLTLGFGFAIVLVPLTLGLFSLLGISELPFWGFVLFKMVYPGAIAFLVTKWIIVRQLEIYHLSPAIS